MGRMAFASVFVAVLVALGAIPARACLDVPSPSWSTADPSVVGAPGGGFTFTVFVGGSCTGAPLQNARVVLDFSGCPGVALCPAPCTGCEADAALHTVAKLTDGFGHASFDLRIGGTCPAGGVQVVADGVPLMSRALASLDQNGDLVVDEQDLAQVQAKLGTHDPTADFDWSGTVDAPDLESVRSRLHTTCDVVVPVRPSSWGVLKLRYR